jgi:hypothetical protein
MAIHLRFFERRDGTVLLPPSDDIPCPADCIDREANTLDEVDKLQKRLQQATYERCQRELQRDEEAFAESRERVRSSLTAKIASSATTEYEREFLRAYIQLREEKRDKYRQRFACDVAYLEMRENDRPRNAEELLKESL